MSTHCIAVAPEGVQGAKPPAGVWGTLSGGQVIPSSSPSYLFRRRRRHESGTRIVTKGSYMVREIHNTSARLMSLRRMFEFEQINVSMRTILTHFLFEFKTNYDTLALLAKNMIYFVTNTITSIAASYFRREDPYT